MTEQRKVKKEGIVFLIVAVCLFLSMSYLTVKFGFSTLNTNELPIWSTLILLFSSIVFIVQNYKNKRMYYMFGQIVVCAGIFIFLLVPQMMDV